MNLAIEKVGGRVIFIVTGEHAATTSQRAGVFRVVGGQTGNDFCYHKVLNLNASTQVGQSHLAQQVPHFMP